jgi:beta-lactamase regulating signal transducer with metallopeptidase domain/5-hydroxyisourate hydrolase-like protein (transthyretin family)
MVFLYGHPASEVRSVTASEISAPDALLPAASIAAEIPARGVGPWSVAAVFLLVLYCGATAVLFAEWLIGVRCLRGISSRSLPASQAVRNLWMSITQGRGESIRTLVSIEVRTPLAYGCLRTTVMIPQSMTAGDATALRFCLAHEWSHIIRQDLPAWRLTWLCQFVLWFQPLFWIMRRELRVCQDFLADHHATNEGADALEYSELLMAFTRQRTGRPIAGAIAFFDQSSQLSRRINMLLNSHVVLRSRSSLKFCLSVIAMSLVCAGLISLVRLDSVQADDTPASATVVKAEEPKVEEPKAKETKAKETKAKETKADEPKSKEQPVEPKTDKPETLRYTAVVLDKETGKGIPNATVVVRRSKLTSEENTIIQETRHKSDAEGKYSFEIPPEQVSVPWLYIELDVEHDDYAAQKGFGYALSMIRKNEKLGERPFFEKVELRPSDPITGTVLAPDGKPLAGVKVQGYSKASAGDFRDYGSFTETVTDNAGKFRLNLVKGGVGVFWVLPVEYASTSRDVNKERGDVGDIVLRPGVRVSGRALNVTVQKNHSRRW